MGSKDGFTKLTPFVLIAIPRLSINLLDKHRKYLNSLCRLFKQKHARREAPANRACLFRILGNGFGKGSYFIGRHQRRRLARPYAKPPTTADTSTKLEGSGIATVSNVTVLRSMKVPLPKSSPRTRKLVMDVTFARFAAPPGTGGNAAREGSAPVQGHG